MDQQTTKRITNTRKSRVVRRCNDRHGALVHIFGSKLRRPGHGCGSLSQGEKHLLDRAGPVIAEALHAASVAGYWRVPMDLRPQKQLRTDRALPPIRRELLGPFHAHRQAKNQ